LPENWRKESAAGDNDPTSGVLVRTGGQAWGDSGPKRLGTPVKPLAAGISGFPKHALF
jgi:hypothetical protein